MEHPAIDPGHFRQVLGCHATGVAIVTALAEGENPVGMAVTSFVSVSLDPPLVAFCPDRRSSTWPRIERAGRFAVNLLSDSQREISRAFATPGADKFAGVDWNLSAHGVPLLGGALATIECKVERVIEAGDHFMVMGRILALSADAELSPLLFFRSAYTQLAAA